MSTDDTASAHARRAGYDRGQYIGGPAERLTREEIDAEKAAQPRPDLCPGAALLAIGEVMAYGYGKHGRCTWRTPGTKQAEPETHIASAFRHLAKMGPAYDALDDESGLPHLHCALSQLAIAVDCIAAGDVQRIASRLAEQPSDWCPRRQCTVRACIDCGIDIEGGPTRCVACADAMGPLPESSWRYEPGAVRISPERLAELRDEVDRAGLQPLDDVPRYTVLPDAEIPARPWCLRTYYSDGMIGMQNLQTKAEAMAAGEVWLAEVQRPADETNTAGPLLAYALKENA
jgi:hypothetical protein